MLPAFLGIGAQKAGTTWLHSMLSTHEEIWLPHLKELHYFDRKFPIKQISNTASHSPGRGVFTRHIATRLRRFDASKLIERLSIRRFGDLTWEFRYLFGDWNDEWYASLFDNVRGRLAGEITPAYSCLGEVAISHVHSQIPNAKLILLLRDPIDRAWSDAKMDLSRAARRTAGQFGDSQYVAHFNGSASRPRGDYLGTIRQWLTRFLEKQFFLGFYDDILSNPEELLLKIFDFPGVSASDRNMPRQVHTRVNPGQQAPNSVQLHQHLAALCIDDLRELAKQFGSYPCRWLEQCETALRDAPSY